METVGRVTQEGLLLTQAMRDYAQHESRGRFIRFALFVALGLIFFLFFFVFLDVASEQGRSRLGFDGLLICLFPVAVWGLGAVLLGRPALVARRLVRYGTYARYVGSFNVRRSESTDHFSAHLEFADKRLTLSDSTNIKIVDIDVLGMYSSGVVDWIPGFHVLAVWDDRGNCVFRAKGYDAGLMGRDDG